MTPTVQAVHSDLLERIREEPYRFLGQASLGCLRVFFDGYMLGRSRAGKANDLDPRLGRFSEWVAEKLGRGLLTVSGINMIQLESEDEARALERYFELWDEYSLVEPEAKPSEPRSMPQIGNLYDLLAAIRPRPGMYLGQSSVTLMWALLQGYLTALQGSCFFTEEDSVLTRFSDWLHHHYLMQPGYRWDRLLLFFERDEARALDAFFTQFDAFQAGWQANR